MPPDADKLRQRHVTAQDDPATTTTTIRSVKDLKGNEIVIDGIIYDLTNFHHPGGEQINVFGGNDVTVHYKMIHPYHTAKHLEKMTAIGKVNDFRIEYQFDTDFEREIKREVYKIVPRGREFGTPGWFFRAFGYIALFFTLQYFWVVSGPTVLLAIAYGMSQALIGMNVQHDANHGAASKKAWINDILGLGADFIGGSKWLWQEQHWTHHSYTNHAEKDPDSFNAEPMLLFNEYPAGDSRRKWYHNFQILFFWPILSGYWLSSVFNPEVLDLNHRVSAGVGERWISPHVASSRKFAIFLRALYIGTNIVAPIHLHGVRVAPLILLMGIAESLHLAILFSLSHNFETADRDPTLKARQTGQPVCWMKSQVETSCTYGGFISGCLTGGLNFQVEHHLFPRMSSAWYPYIAPTVRKVCAKHGVKYAYYPWIWQNLWSTFKYMHAAGTGWRQKLARENPLKGQM
ncbi:hypothetical protein FisN_35Lh015 [Fistulifera solaris]|uniref:Delta5 desaturase-a n=1 Tax=Fistulifera solaris TaxID=1519565 RepID=W0SAJ5_FISSO|nr:delta5 desaturase-a [Fistulifera solaris]GAX28818.1 hypothetical protein FisN_35Lh015 [Fistulifera solaris]|eukprot:GAX28818.1 hypothetical protein FisN_35Lh015 [Fistulifera solaris]